VRQSDRLWGEVPRAGCHRATSNGSSTPSTASSSPLGRDPKFIVTVLFHMEKVTAYVNHSRSRSGVVDEAKPAELVQEIVHALACRADKLG